MPGYRFGCIFRALPEFYTEGKDLTLLDVFRSQGFQPNDRGLAIIQNRSLIGFSREAEIHGRYRGRSAALYFGRGRYNQLALTWPSHGFFRDATREVSQFLGLFRAITALPGAWDVVAGKREDFTMSTTGNRAYLNGPYHYDTAGQLIGVAEGTGSSPTAQMTYRYNRWGGVAQVSREQTASSTTPPSQC